MNKREYISNLLALCEAWMEGKVLQYRIHFDGTETWHDHVSASFPLDIAKHTIIWRVKPSPKMVPFGPGDITHDMVFRHKSWDTGQKRTWYEVGDAGLFFGYTPVLHSFIQLQKSWLCSTDNGKTWRRCEKVQT